MDVDEARVAELKRREIIRGIPLMVLVVVMLLLGIVGNSFSIAFYGFRRRKTVTDFLIASLAANDFLACLVFCDEIPIAFQAFTFTDVTGCKFVFFLNNWMLVNSVMLLTVIAVDRYRRVCHPFSRQMSKDVALRIVIAVTFMTFCLTLREPFLADIVTKPIKMNDNTTLYGYFCSHTDDESAVAVIKASHIMNITIFASAILVIIIVYSFIANAIVKTRSAVLRHPVESSSSTNTNNVEINIVETINADANNAVINIVEKNNVETNNAERHKVDNNNVKTSNVETNNVEINNIETDSGKINIVENIDVETNNVEMNSVENNNAELNIAETSNIDTNIVETNRVQTNQSETHNVEKQASESVGNDNNAFEDESQSACAISSLSERLSQPENSQNLSTESDASSKMKSTLKKETARSKSVTRQPRDRRSTGRDTIRSGESRENSHAEKRVTIMITAFTMASVLSFVPYFAVNLFVPRHVITEDNLSNMWKKIGRQFYMLNCVVNPYVMCCFNNTFRRYVTNFFYQKTCQSCNCTGSN